MQSIMSVALGQRKGLLSYNRCLPGPVQDTWLGRVLNNFRYFEVSHMVMFFLFYAVLLVHPIPGLPGRDNGDRRSVTWVRHLIPHATLSYSCAPAVACRA